MHLDGVLAIILCSEIMPLLLSLAIIDGELRTLNQSLAAKRTVRIYLLS